MNLARYIARQLETRRAQFTSRLSRNLILLDTGCKLWRGRINNAGYARLNVYENSRVVTIYAHRLFWTLANGRNPPRNLQIDHLCRVRHCVNPEHLELVTPRTNVRRAKNRA